ncbi:MAG: InlB B-repeat-containing protein [Clostridia bacterium]|nr:InlB B-repeat-containing protein [Clostridia bacterium]
MTKKRTTKRALQIGFLVLLMLLILPVTISSVSAATEEAYIMRDSTAVPFATLQDALDAAAEGETVYLNSDITASEIISIEKNIVLDGNNHKITSTATRVLNVSANATVKNVDLIGTSSERGVNVIQNEITLTLDNVSVSGISHYALNVTSSAAGSTVYVKNSELTAWGAINLWGDGTSVYVTNSTLKGISNSPNESFGVVVVNDKNITVEILGSSEIIAESQYGAPQSIFLLNEYPSLNANPENAVIKVAETVTVKDVNAQSNITVSGAVAKIDTTYYTSLQSAVDAVKENEVIVLIGDVYLDAALTINKDVTIEGEGFSIIANGGNMDRVIDITAEADVILSELTVNGLAITKAYSRGINVGAKVNLTLEDVDVSMGNYYALNLNNASGESRITVKDSTLLGWAAVNIWATGSTVDIEDSILIGKNVSPLHDSNRFGVLVVNDGTHTVKVYGESEIRAASQNGSVQQIIILGTNTANASVTLDATLTLDESGKTLILSASDVANNTVIVRAEYAQAMADAGLYTVAKQDGLLKVLDEEPVMVDVIFNTNGGSSVTSQTIEAGSNATLPQVPTKDGYTFAGWYTDANLTQAFSFDTAITEDTTLYAKWIEVASETPNPPAGDGNVGNNSSEKDPEPKGNGWIVAVVIVVVVLAGGGCLWFFVFKKKE